MKTVFLYTLLICFSAAFSQQPTIAWQKCIGGTAGEYGWSIKQLPDGNGNYIACGYTESGNGDFSSNHGGDDAALFKLSDNGLVMWTKLYGGTGDEEAIDVIETNGSGFIMIGHTSSNDNDVSGNHGDDDIWVVKTDLTGNIEWQKCYGGSYDDQGEAILQTSDGGYIFIGSTYSSDGDVTGHHGTSAWDMWVVKITSTGTIEWQNCYGGTETEEGYSIAQASNGDYVIAGYTSSTDGDVTGNHGGRDSWIFRISSTGTMIWQKCMGGANTEEFNSIFINTDGTIMALGYSNSTSDDLVGSGYHGDDDFWVVKLGSDGTKIFSKCYGGPYADQANRIAKTTDGNFVLCGLATANGGDVSGLHTSMLGPDIWVVKVSSNGTLIWQKCLGGTDQDEGLYITATADGNCVAAGFTYSVNGDVSGNHGNKDMWFVKLIGGGTSVEELSVSQIILYPNPVNDVVYFGEKLDGIIICDISGRVVLYSGANEISQVDVSALKPGIYFIHSQGRAPVKMVKE
jgi:hypothetical protein